MNALPSSFSMPPGQDPHKYFHNLLIEFKKLLKRSKEIAALQIEMEKLLNASKDMSWKSHRDKTFKKEIGEKACAKVWSEFKRYLAALEKKLPSTNYQDLIDAIEDLETLLENFEVK